jgi:antitoxin YefM
MSKEISYSEAREHLKDHFDYICNNSEAVFVNRRNGDDVVMMSRKDYDSIAETLYLLSGVNNRKILLSAIKNSKKGKKVVLKSKKDFDKFFAI